VSGRDALVGGSVGRSGRRRSGVPDRRGRRRASFREQIEGLLEGGAT
jgi:hypothetical protein